MRTVEITGVDSVATAREAVRELADVLGFHGSETRPLLNVVSELGLFALESGRRGYIKVNHLSLPNRAGICVVVLIPAPSGTQEESVSGSSCGELLPLGGLKRLCDQFEVSQRDGETIVHAVKWRSPPIDVI